MKKFRFAALALMAACSTGDEGPITWEEFQAQAYQEPDSGLYIVNGDEPVLNEDEMRAMYARYVDQFDSYSTTEQALIVHRANGADAKWTSSQAINLTYCIATSGNGGFGSRYSAVKAAMDGASGDWEGVGRVNFVHVTTQDANCTSRNANVVFNVKQVKTSQYLASAFFPNYPRSSRELKISTTSFGNINPWTLRGILRHELGHTLGFRHEHTRPESGTCFEDSNWRALTAYDSSSVMHYPQCNGTQNGDLVITSTDAAGARSLYP
ncbi:MAG TPA: M57 family metalloprotease [Kofleriaceae bacterium]